MKRRPVTLQAVRAAVATLGSLEAFDRMHDSRDWPAVQTACEDNYKRLAMAAHPDRGGCTDRMAELNAARDLVKSIRATRIRRRPQIAAGSYADAVRRMQDALHNAGLGLGDNVFVGSTTSAATVIDLDDFIRVTVIRR